MTDRPPEAALWRSVSRTLAGVVLPAMGPGYARDTARQLSGLAEYALVRGEDATASRSRQLGSLLGLSAEASWPELSAAASGVLVGHVMRPEKGHGRDELRRTLVGYLDEDFEAAQPLLATFARHGEQVEESASGVVVDEAGPLEAWLADRWGGPVRIERAVTMSGGHSRRMLDVVVDSLRGRLALVVRIEQGGVFGTDGASEARIMMALAGAGVATAPILLVEPTGNVLGQPFFVMTRVDGGDAADPVALRSYLHRLHQLHQVPVVDVAAAFDEVPSDAEDGVRLAISHWEEIYRRSASAPIPLLDEGAAWLRRYLQPTSPVAVVHGDPGPGNFLHHNGEITALTDWEFAHLGDAAEDWAYLSAVRGTRLHDEATWHAMLAEVVGISYDPATWKAWTVFNAFKGACANLTALKLFNDGITVWPNLVAVGTAVHLRFLRRLTEMIS